MTARALLGLVAVVGLLAPTALVGCTPSSVSRRVHGQTFEGRFVSEDAYEESLLAAVAEERGDLPTAEHHLRRALRQDPESGDLWSRLGLVVCKRGGDAEDLFRRAEKEEGKYQPTFERWATCAESRGDAARAKTLRDRARGA